MKLKLRALEINEINKKGKIRTYLMTAFPLLPSVEMPNEEASSCLLRFPAVLEASGLHESM